MTDNSNPMQAFTELADQIRREAYAEGYRDALAAVAKAVGDLGPSDLKEAMGPPSPRAAGASQATNTAKAALTVGTTPYYIVSALREKEGMTPSEIIQALQEMGHKAPAASVRTNIHRLKERRIIVARHGKWFVA